MYVEPTQKNTQQLFTELPLLSFIFFPRRILKSSSCLCYQKKKKKKSPDFAVVAVKDGPVRHNEDGS